MFSLRNIPKNFKNLNNYLKLNSNNSFNFYQGYKKFSTAEGSQTISSRFHEIYVKELEQTQELK